MKWVSRIFVWSLLLFVLFGIWTLFFPHRDSSGGVVSLADAENCPIALPESARNIQYATYMHWIAFQDFVRFEAPAEVCRAHAAVVYADCQKQFESMADEEIPKFEPLDRSPSPIMFAEVDTSWFDIQNIKNGLIAQGSSCVPTIWIDLDRNIFYYRFTD